jgi:histidinol dehydrogenase
MTSSLNITRLDHRRHDVAGELARLRERLSPRGDILSEAGRHRTIAVFGEPLSPAQVVERICGDIRQRGIDAVLEYSRRLDGADLRPDEIRVPAGDLRRAHADADPAFLLALRRVRDNVLRFQSAVRHRDVSVPLAHGGFLRQRYTPLDRVGLYFPGGAALYPSTVVMTVVPAQAAGVGGIAVASPPTPLGAYHPDLLAACHELGVTEVYRVGGAQAVAALAYGVEGLPRVDKVCGPGNIFVALAKRFVFGEVGIDSMAGPSEVVILADETADPSHVALDLISQSEHSPGSSVLVTWSEPLWTGVANELGRQLDRLARGDLARHSLEEYGALVLVSDKAAAVRLADSLASEHVHLQCAGASDLLPQITKAGAVFVGGDSPVAVGDYAAGPSHVLPTGGTARFSSGLSSNDFLRSTSILHFTRDDLAAVAEDVAVLAEKEGLTAHHESVRARLASLSAG